MATTNLTIRMDSDLKEQLKMVAEEMGMDLTTLFTIYAKKVARTGTIPFTISDHEVYNEETRRAIEDVKNGRNLGRAYDSVEEMMEDLLKDEDDDDDEYEAED